MIKNIAIIGAGWVGCHLAKHLIDRYNVSIFESNDVFHSASSNNQNRLHLGFHYARNYRTRFLCIDTFSKFNEEYGEFVQDITNNIYAVSNKSLIDFKTYTDIFEHNKVKFSKQYFDYLKNIEGSIVVDEKYIDFKRTAEYFKSILQQNIVRKTINNLDELDDYDLIINCTNNVIKNPCLESFYEVTLSSVYIPCDILDFNAITIVDGDFFSIFPYKTDMYSLTDVEFTPIFSSSDYNEICQFRDNINSDLITNRIKLMERKVLSIYPDFKEKFKHTGHYLSLKSKFESSSADRYPVVNKVNKTIHCFTGKIQGIYYIQNEIEKHLRNADINR